MASVALPDGVAVQARALGAPRPRQPPAFGVYLCGRRSRRRVARGWTGTWRAVWLDWPPLVALRDWLHEELARAKREMQALRAATAGGTRPRKAKAHARGGKATRGSPPRTRTR